MMKSKALFAALIFPAIVLSGAVENLALAQEKKIEKSDPKGVSGEVTTKEVEQNDKVRVYESTFNPGDVAKSAKRPMRVIHAIEGGTLERTYDDGKKEIIPWKTGETRIITEERPYAVKNIGKSVVHLLIVVPK